MNNNIKNILDRQREYYRSGATLPVGFRIEMLKKLYATVKKHEADIVDALRMDLGKSENESYMCEIGMVLSGISYMIKHVPKFAKIKRVHTPIALFSAKSYKVPMPYGNVLIMSPWNYPFLLALAPLTEAMAAGNTAVLKLSAYSPTTSSTVKKIIEECFEPEYVSVVTGGRKENSELLDLKFDFVFFTGSQRVGKEVLRRSSENLIPVVLELGGKSPCIVDSSAKIKVSAKRVVFGKLLNCGQTCVAPDYVLCEKSIKDEFVREVVFQIKEQFGENPIENPNYGKIINEKHFMRISSLIDKDKIVYGGKCDREKLKIEPTVLDNVTWQDAVMQEEIFGPVLPIMTFDSFDDIYSMLSDKEKPLALYLFSENKQRANDVMHKFQYGGGCINDCVIHLATSELGFGGVGESGMGAYHGKAGFETFSHIKSVVKKGTRIDPSMRYQPYGKNTDRLVHKFLK